MSHTALHSTNALNSYSSFFSSGLLAPHTPRVQHQRDTVSSWDSDADDSFSPTSPSPSSPIVLPDEESMMDVDMSGFAASTLRPTRENDSRRSATPTSSSSSMRQREGQTTPMQHSPQSIKGAVVSSLPVTMTSTTTSTTAQPRLRRRRSSLTQATSPMNAIRSPARAAGNALHHHLQQTLPAGTSRSRSGSLSLAGDAMGAGTYSSSLVGRMRSGSCSSSASSELAAGLGVASKVLAPSFRTRRGARRNHPAAAMPALRAPPPTAPLPDLPLAGIPQQQQLRPSNLNLQTSARARGLSVSSSKLGGDENRIEEEMKEN